MRGKVDRLVEIISDLNVRDLRKLHIIFLVTFLRAAHDKPEMIEKSIPPILPYLSRRVIFDPFFRGIKFASEIIQLLKPKLDFSDIEIIIDRLKKDLKNVNAVFVIDCFSPMEFLTYLTKLRLDGYNSELLDIYFTNIAGLTRFLTEQAGGSIRKFSEYLAERLDFKFFDKYSYFDKIVHTSILLRDFIESVPHDEIYDKIVRILGKYKSVLLTSDHGYDVVNVEGLLYVTHPAREGILKFSNVALYLVAWR